MATRLRPLETTGLYLLIFGFSLFFFAAGLMVGRWLPRDPDPPAPEPTPAAVGDNNEDLGIYREIVGASREEPARGDDSSSTADPVARSAADAIPSAPDDSEDLPVHPGPSFFTVQVGAFSDISAVNQLVLRLGAKGYPSRVVEPGEQGNQAYLIWVDGVESRSEAESIEKRLKEDGFPTFIKQISGVPGQ